MECSENKYHICTLSLSKFSALQMSVYLHRATFMYEQFPEVMNMLWFRMLKDNKKNWRRVYKVNIKLECFFGIVNDLGCEKTSL